MSIEHGYFLNCYYLIAFFKNILIFLAKIQENLIKNLNILR